MVQNVTVFEEGVFKEVIKFKGDQDGLIQYDRCLMRRGDEDTGRHKRENHLKIQGSRWPSISSREREASEQTKPVNTLFLDFQPPELQENKFPLFKPPRL